MLYHNIIESFSWLIGNSFQYTVPNRIALLKQIRILSASLQLLTLRTPSAQTFGTFTRTKFDKMWTQISFISFFYRISVVCMTFVMTLELEFKVVKFCLLRRDSSSTCSSYYVSVFQERFANLQRSKIEYGVLFLSLWLCLLSAWFIDCA